MSVDGTRVLVTGGTSGLGLAMAQALAGAGARVALTGRDPVRAASAADPLGALGVGMDVREPASVERGVATVLEAFGGVDVLVNNAGIGMRTVDPGFLTAPQPFWAVSPEGFSDLFATNVTGYFLVARAVVPSMVEAGAGTVVNVSINAATQVRRGFTPYGPSRAASDALSAVMAADLEGTGVDVHLLLPGGATATGMIPEDLPEAARAGLLDPSVMGPPVLWLAGGGARGRSGLRVVANDASTWG